MTSLSNTTFATSLGDAQKPLIRKHRIAMSLFDYLPLLHVQHNTGFSVHCDTLEWYKAVFLTLIILSILSILIRRPHQLPPISTPANFNTRKQRKSQNLRRKSRTPPPSTMGKPKASKNTHHCPKAYKGDCHKQGSICTKHQVYCNGILRNGKRCNQQRLSAQACNVCGRAGGT